ncbi:MAG TPA: DEAD/DEAH box helicase [Vicinamibacterales bacterium]|nr:DEAD/DEAH box helicase [Vicinamibacterales bacterium]
MPPSDHQLTRVLAPDVPGGSRAKGRAYYLNGAVTRIDGNASAVAAIVNGSRAYDVTIERDGEEFYASCDCPYFLDRFDICKHVWAALLAAEDRQLLLGGGPPSEYATIRPEVDAGIEDPEFALPRASVKRAAAARPDAPASRALPDPRTSWQRFLQEFSRRLEQRDVHRLPRFLDAQLVYVIDRAQTLSGQGLALELHARQRKKNGDWGKPKAAAVTTLDLEHLTDAADREILPYLLGATDAYHFGYSAPFGRTSFHPVGPLLDRVLPLVVRSGRALLRIRPKPAEELVPLAWDDGPPWRFRFEIVHASADAEFSIDGALVRNGDQLAIRTPWMVLASGYVFHGNTVARLDARGAFAWLAQLRGSGPVAIPPDATGQLVDVLARSGVDPGDLPEELQFEIAVEAPRPRVSVRAERASVASLLRASVSFDYGGLVVDAETGGTAFDPDRRRLVRRDLALEESALSRLSQLGFSRQWDYAASRQSLAIAAPRFPSVVRTLVREGWHVEADGRMFRTAESVRSEIRSGIDWFELHGSVDFGEGRVVELPRLLQALKQGHATVTLDDGTAGVLPEDWLRRWAGIAEIGEASGDHVRFRLSQAALVDAALASQEPIRVDERFAKTREELASFGGITPLDAASSFAGQLRDYQRDALGWFDFLRRFGFGGCLADDMGLGKTVMVLAWLDRLRAERKRAAPSLVVAPRSVVFNWQAEAARFAPKLRVFDFSGSDRTLAGLDRHDLALTTYGTLRRDALILKDVEFEYVILDEAQAIKNASTVAAKAARLLRAKHRLALSGTPIENHLGELWSLFEFLNPGLLGTSSAFGRHSAAAAKRDQEAMDVLARGLRPFVLRRTKAQVAPELPSRTELTIRCELHGAQRELYDELRAHYRAALLSRIAREGLQKSKMQILEALLRLRQAACHPGLIDPRRAGAASAKFDALLPRLAELADEGHKSLIFSQFTSLLALLRARLDEAGVVYEYLDGHTRDRAVRVNRFQEDPACGLFLISLKAGGLGLNLTAAEYVFLLDPWWNPAVEAQAIDRAHRIGQRNHVFAYRLLASDTVEDKIAELQQSKRALADAILEADAGLLRDLKRDDLEVLLG